MLDYPIIAIGDLHGQRRWLEQLLNRLRQHPIWPRAKLVFLGDLVDRGPEVRATVEMLLSVLREKPGSVCLAGNHDYALVKAASLDGSTSTYWPNHYAKNYDHQPTFRSYLGRSGNTSSPEAWAFDLAELKAAMPLDHREFLANLPWVAEASGHVFIHNGLSPAIDEPAEIQLELLRRKRWHGYVTPKSGTGTHLHYQPEYPVWLGADKSLSANPLPVPHRVIVSGHVRVEQPDVNAVRVRIDTSGGVQPPLTACILSGPTEREFVFSE
jgi:serine/threonine protein phosphatase 1